MVIHSAVTIGIGRCTPVTCCLSKPPEPLPGKRNAAGPDLLLLCILDIIFRLFAISSERRPTCLGRGSRRREAVHPERSRSSDDSSYRYHQHVSMLSMAHYEPASTAAVPVPLMFSVLRRPTDYLYICVTIAHSCFPGCRLSPPMVRLSLSSCCLLRRSWRIN